MAGYIRTLINLFVQVDGWGRNMAIYSVYKRQERERKERRERGHRLGQTTLHEATGQEPAKPMG